MPSRLKRIGPLSLAKVCAVLYGIGGLIAAPILLLGAVFGVTAYENDSVSLFVAGLLMTFVIPVIYAIAGFLGGLILACLYNLVARWLGGIEFEVE